MRTTVKIAEGSDGATRTARRTQRLLDMGRMKFGMMDLSGTIARQIARRVDGGMTNPDIIPASF